MSENSIVDFLKINNIQGEIYNDIKNKIKLYSQLISDDTIVSKKNNNIDPAYLRYLNDKVIDGSLEINNPNSIPKGISEMYIEKINQSPNILMDDIIFLGYWSIISEPIAIRLFLELSGLPIKTVNSQLEYFYSWFTVSVDNKYIIRNNKIKLFILSWLPNLQLKKYTSRIFNFCLETLKESGSDTDKFNFSSSNIFYYAYNSEKFLELFSSNIITILKFNNKRELGHYQNFINEYIYHFVKSANNHYIDNLKVVLNFLCSVYFEKSKLNESIFNYDNHLLDNLIFKIHTSDLRDRDKIFLQIISLNEILSSHSLIKVSSEIIDEIFNSIYLKYINKNILSNFLINLFDNDLKLFTKFFDSQKILDESNDDNSRIGDKNISSYFIEAKRLDIVYYLETKIIYDHNNLITYLENIYTNDIPRTTYLDLLIPFMIEKSDMEAIKYLINNFNDKVVLGCLYQAQHEINPTLNRKYMNLAINIYDEVWELDNSNDKLHIISYLIDRKYYDYAINYLKRYSELYIDKDEFILLFDYIFKSIIANNSKLSIGLYENILEIFYEGFSSHNERPFEYFLDLNEDDISDLYFSDSYDFQIFLNSLKLITIFYSFKFIHENDSSDIKTGFFKLLNNMLSINDNLENIRYIISEIDDLLSKNKLTHALLFDYVNQPDYIEGKEFQFIVNMNLDIKLWEVSHKVFIINKILGLPMLDTFMDYIQIEYKDNGFYNEWNYQCDKIINEEFNHSIPFSKKPNIIKDEENLSYSTIIKEIFINFNLENSGKYEIISGATPCHFKSIVSRGELELKDLLNIVNTKEQMKCLEKIDKLGMEKFARYFDFPEIDNILYFFEIMQIFRFLKRHDIGLYLFEWVLLNINNLKDSFNIDIILGCISRFVQVEDLEYEYFNLYVSKFITNNTIKNEQIIENVKHLIYSKNIYNINNYKSGIILYVILNLIKIITRNYISLKNIIEIFIEYLCNTGNKEVLLYIKNEFPNLKLENILEDSE